MIKKVTLILLLFSIQTIISQTEFNGKVIDKINNPIPYANVIVKKKLDSTIIKGTITDFDGNFKFKVTSPKDTYLTISIIGYKTKIIKNLTLKEIGLIKLLDQSQQLDEVTVTGQKPFIQKQQDKLIVNVANSSINSGNSLIEVLEKSPGILIDQDDNISLNGRNAVRIYVDNKDTRLQGEQLANFLRSIPSSNIEKIEIISNPSVKYEAQGNAGIINIVTKKGKFYGTNGSLTIAPGIGKKFRFNSSANFNHRTDKINMYGQYSYNELNRYSQLIMARTFLNNSIPTAFYQLDNKFNRLSNSHSGRLGIDYNVNSLTTIGILISGLNNKNNSKATNNILGYNTKGDFISEENTNSKANSKWNRINTNFNITHKFKNKSNLNFNFDFAKYDNSSLEELASTIENHNTNSNSQNILLGDINGILNLSGLTLDYELPLVNGNKIEIGWKNTWVETDNNLMYHNKVNGINLPNLNLSNHFIYKENIYAGYVSYSMNNKKWNAQLGVRIEKTDVEGNQLTSNNNFKNNYTNFFPTASYNYTINKNHSLGITAGRRIDRPGYNQLNPFRVFINTNTYREGNPFLKPQFTWSSELSYTLKKRYYFSFNYGYTNDNLNMAIIREGNDEVVILKPLNISNLKSYSFSASVPIKIIDSWRSNWNFNANLNDFDGEINGFNFNRTNPIISINTNHRIQLGNGYRIQLNGFYLFPHYASNTRLKGISSISLGAQKNILKGKGTIRFNINDIFWNQYPSGRTNFGNLDEDFTSYRDSRFATLSFSWRFGKQSLKVNPRRVSEIQNELNRARQSNN